MALRPKLEFYRLRLVTHDGEYRTFRDFAVDELYQRRPSGDTQIMNKLFDHFMGGLAFQQAGGRCEIKYYIWSHKWREVRT